MLGWFRSSPRCPVPPTEQEWIETRMQWLGREFGWERLRQAEVILPRPEYFPDSFEGTPEDVRLLLDRVSVYMGIHPDVVDLEFYEDRNPVHDADGRRSAAGMYAAESGRHRIGIEIASIGKPLALVATMAHELAHVHLIGHGRLPPETDDQEPLTDLLTVYLGMGVITANAVIQEHYGVTGWSIGRQGYLTMPMFGYALALFAWVREEPAAEWAAELRLDVRRAFKEGVRYLQSLGGAAFQPAR